MSQSFSTAFVTASVNAFVAAERGLLTAIVSNARKLGQLTEADWEATYAAPVKAALEKAKLSDAKGKLSRIKLVTLVTACRPARVTKAKPFWGDVREGEALEAFCQRVRPSLPDAKLPDGRFVRARGADGKAKPTRGRKATGTGKAAAKAAAPKVPAVDAKDAALVNACAVVMGSGAKAALLARIVREGFRDELEKFMTDTLARHDEAKATAKAMLDASAAKQRAKSNGATPATVN